MKVLVTGTEGYLGSLLAPSLVQAGMDVTGFDTGFFRENALYTVPDGYTGTLQKDIRRLSVEDFSGVDAVVHMAELSNDPLGELAPHITRDINHKGSARVAELAKLAGVSRFIYMSSCSVYGIAEGEEMVETSPVNPQTEYAACKVLMEQKLAELADDSFSPIILRNATAYGASPRMRFDIVVNNLTGVAWTTQEIKMTSDGTPWRPLVHGLDIAKAIRCALTVDRERVHNQIFNVGSNRQNYRISEIATKIAEVFTGCEVSFGQNGGDNRSYRVNFDKIHTILPEFSCDWDVDKGIRQLHEVYSRIGLTSEMFLSRDFTRLKQLQHLIDTRQIDADFFWQKNAVALKGSV